MSRKEGAVEYMTEQNHHDRPSTVRSFLTDHAGEAFSMMTPCGFVELTAAQAEALLDGQSAVAHPGVAGITMELSADELLVQTIHSANLKDGVWYLMTQFPEMEYSGPEMGVMQ